jgi:hypothetical protein
MVRLLFITFALVGCAREIIRYEPMSLPLPPKSVLPTIKPLELQCLSDDTYTKFDQREETLKHDYHVLKGIICSTRKGSCPKE